MAAVVITLSISPKLLLEIDRAAEHEGLARSELLREGCRRYLYDMERWRQLRKIGARSAVRARVKSEQEVYALFRAERRTSSGKRRSPHRS